MEMPKDITIIAGIQKKDRVLGNENDLLYKIPADMKRFRELTTGNVVVMGRKTWESLPDKYRPLPNRTNIVVSRDRAYTVPEGVILASSIEEALQKSASFEKEVFIIGGATLYEKTIPYAQKLYLTIFKGDRSGDVFFPPYEDDFKKETAREDHIDEASGVAYSFVTLKR